MVFNKPHRMNRLNTFSHNTYSGASHALYATPWYRVSVNVSNQFPIRMSAHGSFIVCSIVACGLYFYPIPITLVLYMLCVSICFVSCHMCFSPLK